MKGLLLILLVVVLVALGIHLTDYDVDLWTLFRTHSFEQSRVETKKWIKIIGSECVTDTINCAHFSTQKEAQDKYEYCAEKIAKINSYDTYRIKNLDIYGLDGDNDGIVCEILK